MTQLDKVQRMVQICSILVLILMIFSLGTGVVLLAEGIYVLAADAEAVQGQIAAIVSSSVNLTGKQFGGMMLARGITGLLYGCLLTGGFICMRKELKTGTPFTLPGVIRIRNLGIGAIAAGLLITWTNSWIYQWISLGDLNNAGDSGGVVLGILLLILSAVLRYGAELERR